MAPSFGTLDFKQGSKEWKNNEILKILMQCELCSYKWIEWYRLVWAFCAFTPVSPISGISKGFIYGVQSYNTVEPWFFEPKCEIDEDKSKSLHIAMYSKHWKSLCSGLKDQKKVMQCAILRFIHHTYYNFQKFNFMNFWILRNP